MFRKSSPVLVLLVVLAAPSFAAGREVRTREPRLRDRPVMVRIIDAVKRILSTGDGITIPKP
jgi:hypothetical protein